MNQLPPYVQPEAWQQFWKAQANMFQQAQPANDASNALQSFTRMQSQYIQSMLGDLQQLTDAMTRPETLPQQYSQCMQRSMERTMQHTQDMMRLVGQQKSSC